jgi:hypothetical protein
MHYPRASTHIAQCPTCGLPMSLARMEPDPDRAGRADRYTYECGSGHSMSKTTEKNGVRPPQLAVLS